MMIKCLFLRYYNEKMLLYNTLLFCQLYRDCMYLNSSTVIGETDRRCCLSSEISCRFGSFFICSRVIGVSNFWYGMSSTTTRDLVLGWSAVGSGKDSWVTCAIPTISFPSLLWYRKQRSHTLIALRLFLAW